ncbi:MAG: type II toxin-antitoxin system HicB family antitoxin [Acidobacteriaceae bacterium]|nr:type II toxin-antitoxin system HicB family antitoxin [Acidobacteriaceae bacterium]
MAYTLEVEFEREDDGRWIAEIPSLPGVMAYGATKEEAASKVEAIALRVVADEIERERTIQNSVQFAIA